MTMTFFLHDNLESADSFEPRETHKNTQGSAGEASMDELHILWEKMCVPQFGSIVERTRLDEMLKKSLSQFGATLISGRAGTGKSALAASFSRTFGNVAWYSVESSDIEWKSFSRYFSASVLKSVSSDDTNLAGPKNEGGISLNTISRFLAGLFSKVEWLHANKPLLIVLDDVHRIFDAEWFCDFFNLLLYSLPPDSHLLLLCRSKPPNPLWRLRSKQMLNVIDEKLLAFNLTETEEFFRSKGLTKKTARRAHADSFGRISKLIQIASECEADIAKA